MVCFDYKSNKWVYDGEREGYRMNTRTFACQAKAVQPMTDRGLVQAVAKEEDVKGKQLIFVQIFIISGC